MAQQTMYAGQVNSPETTITNNIATIDTTIYVLDPARVPTPLPNLMTLGTGTNAETVKVTAIADNALTVERGFQGVAKDWLAGTIIARNYTAYDHDTVKANIEDLETAKISKSLATAADQALVSTGAGAWAVKTLAQIKTWLGLKAAAFLDVDVEGGVASHNALETHTAESASQADLGHVKLPENWIAPTLLNGWVDYGGVYETSGYYKDDFGVVHLRGLIKSGTTTGGTVIFTLPTGYRPSGQMLFPAFMYNNAFGAIEIFSNGDVAVSLASTTFTSLSGISFKI